MKTVQFVIGAATCLALSACTGLLPKQEPDKGCYPVNTLSAEESVALNVGNGNPIFLIGGEEIVCSCYRSGSLAGAGEEGHLVGAEEKGRLAGAAEEGHLAGAEEKGRLAGAAEESHLAGAEEKGRLVGAAEKGHLAGAEEKGRLTGAAEGSHLAGAFAEFSCRIVPECPDGFQLIGYEPDQVKIRTGTRQKFVSTDCITW